MTTCTSDRNGRLCNQIFRNLAVSLIAEKYDLRVNYSSHKAIERLGLELFSGQHTYGPVLSLNDNNYISILQQSDELRCNLDANSAYFQTREISNIIYDHIRSDRVKPRVVEVNPFKSRYDNNNDVFIHMRLTDAAEYSPGVKYYLDALNSILKFDNVYLATDEFSHPFVQQFLSVYPMTQKIEEDDIRTIQFGSTCKHIILSHGSYSAIIGYLGYFSNVHYPVYEKRITGPWAGTVWCGDMFTNQGWTKHTDHINTRGYAYQERPANLLPQ